MERSAIRVVNGGAPPDDDVGTAEDEVRVISLGRGHGMVIRPLRAADRPALEAFFAELPDDDVRVRFLSGSRPSRHLLDHWFDAGDRERGRLVAIEDGELVGDAGWFRVADDDAELDIAVRAHHRGWLGPFLLDAVVEHAREHGIRNLIAHVDRSNAPMLAVLRERGYATIGHDGGSVLRVAIGARHAVPVWPERRPGVPRILVEGHALPWSADDLARQHTAEIVACHAATTPGPSRCPALTDRPCPLVLGADAVVVSLPADDERAIELLDAHQRQCPNLTCFVSGWHTEAPGGVTSIAHLDLDGIEAVIRQVATSDTSVPVP